MPLLGTSASQNTKSFLSVNVDFLVVAGGGGGGPHNNGHSGGGGGSAGYHQNFDSFGTEGTGGSGVVILRALQAASATTGDPVATTSGSYYIYQFNDTGSITF